MASSSLGCLTQSQINDIWLSHLVISTLSTLSCLFILATYLIFSHFLKSFIMRYIAYLTFSNLIYSLTSMTSSFFVSDEASCMTLAFMCLYGAYCTTLWICIFSHMVYQIIKDNINPIKTEKIHLLTAFLMPLPLCFMTLAWGDLGNYGNIYCLFDIEKNATIPFFVFADSSVAAALIFVTIMTILSIRHAYKTFTPEDARGLCYQMLWYPVSLAFIIGMYFVSNLLMGLNTCGGFVVSLMAITCRSSHGFVNAIVYGFNRDVKLEVYKVYRTWTDREKPSTNISNEMVQSFSKTAFANP